MATDSIGGFLMEKENIIVETATRLKIAEMLRRGTDALALQDEELDAVCITQAIGIVGAVRERIADMIAENRERTD